jgi:hypothetical protein
MRTGFSIMGALVFAAASWAITLWALSKFIHYVMGA